MHHHLLLPPLSVPPPYHMHSPEGHQQRAAVSPAPLLCFFPVEVLKSFLFLPSCLHFSPSRRSPEMRLSAQHFRPQRGGTAGLGGAAGALTDSTDNHCNRCRVRKVGGKQLFPKCHHQRPPLRWCYSLWVRDGEDWREGGRKDNRRGCSLRAGKTCSQKR